MSKSFVLKIIIQQLLRFNLNKAKINSTEIYQKTYFY